MSDRGLILAMLSDARIFEVEWRNDEVFPGRLIFTEACDRCFHAALSVEEVETLASELLKLVDSTMHLRPK